jgi:hypothetical protein
MTNPDKIEAPDLKTLHDPDSTYAGDNTILPSPYLAPPNAEIVSTTPRLQWKAMPNAKKYRLEFFDETPSGKQALGSQEVASLSAAFPNPLQRGHAYRFQITEIDGKPVRFKEGSRWFRVASAAKAEQFAAATYEYACTLYALGRNAEARQLLTEVLEIQPKKPLAENAQALLKRIP